MESETDNVQPGETVGSVASEGRQSPKSRRRKLVVSLIVAAVLAALGLATGAGLLAAQLLRAGGEITGEWKQRVAADYPGWEMVGFNVRSFSGPSGSQTDYTITMVPPGRDFAIGIVYIAKDDGEAACKDEVLRPGGLHSEGADSLLDYIEREYVAEDKSVVSVTTERDGSVTVNWLQVHNYLIFSSRVGSFDVLEYDSDTDTWDASFSPDAFPS